MLSIPVPQFTLVLNVICKLWACQPVYKIPEIRIDPLDTPIDNNIRATFDENVKLLPPIVETEGGVLEGYFMTTSGGRRIYAFEGIKYGTAERWKAPEPVKAWNDILQAKAPGSQCLQFNAQKYLKIYGYEDCLFLNVYTPSIEVSAKLPVVVYIHGGSYIMGSGEDHGPAYLLNKNVVLVNFNYRLGVLGFLSTGDNIISGNWGLKDQALAIQWVKDNIGNFGGDPNNLTLWGYSAGASSTHLHMMSPKTKHLLSKAISNSGSAFAQWALHSPERAKSTTIRMANHFGCQTKISQEIRDCLMKISSLSLVSAQARLFKWFPFPGVIFTPTIELNDTRDAFITMSPEESYTQNQVANIPYISSSTKDEALSVILASKLINAWTLTKTTWYRNSKYVLDLNYMYGSRERNKALRRLTRKITKFYLKGKLPLFGTRQEYSDMITDRYFHFALAKSLQAHSIVAPTYSYLFSFHNGSYNYGNLYKYTSQEWGAGHGEDEFYLFNCTALFPGFKKSDPEYKLSKIMLNLMYNFIVSGKPVYTDQDQRGENIEIWKPIVDAGNLRLLQFDNEIKMIKPNLGRLKFWQDLKIPDTTPWLPL